ncbi:MAG: DUF6429 family protein [Bacteroidota bacterium]
MNIDESKVDEIVLALLHLTSFKDSEIKRSWKSYDWNVLDRLHAKGFISDPKTKAKSVILSDEGVQQVQLVIKKYFSQAG